MIRKVLAAALLLFSAAGCGSVFYQPSSAVYYDPVEEGYDVEDVFFESIDGTPLHGWLFSPPQGKKPRATVVHFHGNAENITSFYRASAWMAKEGFEVFIFDYRGYGRSRGQPSAEGVNYDGISALRWAHERMERGRSPGIVVLAQSLGGAIALRALRHYPHRSRLKAVIIDSAFVDYQSIAREKLSNVWLTWPLQWLAYPLVSNEYSPKADVGGLGPVPLLVVHGDNDMVVPTHHGLELYGLAKGPKDLWVVRGGSHIDAFFDPDSKYRGKLLAWLAPKL